MNQPTHQETMVQAYSTDDGTPLLWKTVLNEVHSGESVSNQDQVYVITNRHFWKLDQHGNVLWSDPNLLSASNDVHFNVLGDPAATGRVKSSAVGSSTRTAGSTFAKVEPAVLVLDPTADVA